MEEGFKACPHCGEPIREAATICRYGNRTVRGVAAKPDSAPASERPQAAGTRSRGKTGVLVAVVLGLAVWATWRITQPSQKVPDDPRFIAQVVHQPVPITLKILNGNVEVAASQIRWVTFTVPPNSTNAKIMGAFHAFGGGGNDIQVIITDPFNFENWKNNHETPVLYNSDKVTNAEIAVVQGLQPGQYVLAFDNRFSAFSRKEITGQITLTYLLP